ncbi:hypothetical protein SCUCBS95973_007873 [Sporothrix curviconia]|uniref:Uncharacterized protein n=1 Tax=Sporothrix curviconia TaxID=1260050 RepID=A0ABP0CGV2_9PEZI
MNHTPGQSALCAALDEQCRDPDSFAGHRLWEEDGKDAPEDLAVSVTVNGVGVVAFPLHEAQAQRIIAQARRPAVHATGRAWELDPSQFSLTGNADHWAKIQSKALRMVFDELHVHFLRREILAKPDKMVLYEAGAYVEPYTDLSYMAWYKETQREVTPITSGFCWVLTYHLAIGRVPLWRTPPCPPTGQACLASAILEWLSEVQHRAPVLQSKAAAAKAAVVQAEADAAAADAAWKRVQQECDARDREMEMEAHAQLACLHAKDMQVMADDANHPLALTQHVIYTLDFPYDEFELPATSFMTKKDESLYNAVCNVTRDMPVDVFLCTVVDAEYGICEESYSPYRELERLRENVARSIPLNPDTILQEVPSGTVVEQTSFRDNKACGHASAVHEERRAGIVIVPRSTLHHFLCCAIHDKDTVSDDAKYDLNLQTVVTNYARKCIDPTREQDKANLHLLSVICEYAWDLKIHIYKRAAEDSDNDVVDFVVPTMQRDTITDLLFALVRMRDWVFFDRVIARAEGDFDAVRLFTFVEEEVNREKKDPLVFSRARESLRRAVLSLASLATAMEVVRILAPPRKIFDHDFHKMNNPDKVDWTWGHETFDCLLQKLERGSDYAVGHQEGQGLFHMGLSYYGMGYVQTSFKSTETVLRRLENPDEMEDTPDWRAVDRNVATAVDSEVLFFFCYQLLELGEEHNSAMGTLAREMLLKLAEGVSALHAACSSQEAKASFLEGLKDLWLPLLGALADCPYLVDDYDFGSPGGSKTGRTPFQSLTVAVLDAYLDLELGVYPVKDPSLYRPPFARCTLPAPWDLNCRLCPPFNKFLQSTEQASLRTTIPRECRLHLEKQVAKFGADVSVEVLGRSSKKYSSDNIVVTKTWKKHKDRCKAWKDRRGDVDRLLQETFSPDDLRYLLSEADYERITRMKDLKPPKTVRPLDLRVNSIYAQQEDFGRRMAARAAKLRLENKETSTMVSGAST